ncbi:hypothetical protein DPSP01_000696 [Paraphaeosphaeria sporulosa]|uniref:Kinetochore protein fta4 n=1 Tax=Paraphaeosphaeria sporulosa TaxID=1460663 RepID=A0A177CPY5_9PLEO|nr:uncharacterized protein CC84DRAFT_1255602 [Paraphaeosphaeria sporulosa]OAG09583.1 hypothetical protein CC84DRAFT_1255602 [Paraphaeosphaeria sporulosa]
MSSHKTIVEQKQQFLQSKKQYLSRGIAPSEKLKQIALDGGVELSVLKGAVDKVNRELKQHSRRVYSRQMSEHVVEQIDTFYWESGSRDVDDEAIDTTTDMTDDEHAIYQGEDLTQDAVIAKLPTRWDTSSDPTPSSAEEHVDQDDYLSAITRLQSLSAHRLTLQQKLNTYRTLLALLEPYRNPKNNVQPNLVWKDSPLATELGKTRTLAIRVAGRLGEKFGDVQVPATDEGRDIDMSEDANDKVNRVLAGW